MSDGINRRDFLILTSLGAAGGCVLGGEDLAVQEQAMHGGGMGGGGCTVIDPPVGPAFADPPVMTNNSTTPGVVDVSLEAKVSTVNVNGVNANLLTYNGAFPGATIRVAKGDLLRIRFTNSLPATGNNILGHPRDMTNLHTHGLHVSPSGQADDVLLHFENGDTHTFEYDTSKVMPGALAWYHPHAHGTVAEQLWAGMAGALIVEDQVSALTGYETHVMVIKDLTLSGSSPAAYTDADYSNGKEGTLVLVNGQRNPVLSIRPGQVQRWRILNACTARYLKLSLAGHSLNIVGTDGGLLDRPYAVSSFLVPPGERIDVLVRASTTPGSYKLVSQCYSRGMNAQQQVTLLTMSNQGTSMSQALPSSVNPAASRITATPTVNRTLQLGGGMMGGGFTINGQNFNTDPLIITSTVGTYERWTFQNMTMMDHPMHLHVNEFQVESISGGDAGYASFLTTAPALKDTVNVPAMGSATILVPVKDYTGRAVMHCHIVEHEDIGMMAIWDLA